MATTPILHLPYPGPDDTVDVPRDVQALATAMDPLGTVPVGAMMMWPGAAAPSGWLLMQGQQVTSAQYPGLAAVLGEVSGQVTIPDLRDRFPVGAGPTMGLGATGGATSVILAKAHMPVHDHNGKTGAADRALTHGHAMGGGLIQPRSGGYIGGNFNVYQAQAGLSAVDGWASVAPNLAFSVTAAAAPDHLHTIGAEGGDSAHENCPPYRAVNYIIRAG